MKKPASSRFIWETADLVFVDAVPPGLSKKPDWPRSIADLTAISRLAGWVQERMPEAFVDWDEAYHAAEADLLSKAERRALVDAFDNRGKVNRWKEVVAIFRSGIGSPRFMATVESLIKLDAFTRQTDLTRYNLVESARDRDLVEGVLLSDYRTRPRQSVRRMATKIAAILLNPASATKDAELLRRQTADVQKAMKQRADKKDGLDYLCWRVAKDRTAD